ncbi:MAG: hypothetical protein ACP5SH_05480 [Syntrophobacteraceae bacterium]
MPTMGNRLDARLNLLIRVPENYEAKPVHRDSFLIFRQEEL